ncbi:MAG: hypothetical protein MO852_12305, partial [Candidatus Devosia euplotis]|nr:hypothetical protein [Candidatus Devosia euplotis]
HWLQLGRLVTGGSAQEIASNQSATDVAAALTPYCVQQSRTDTNRVSVMAELAEASTYLRRGIVEKAGWATPLGAEKPSREPAQSCALALEESRSDHIQRLGGPQSSRRLTRLKIRTYSEHTGVVGAHAGILRCSKHAVQARARPSEALE